ncbi:hypothetical protein [Microbacterium sp.]|uniref:hypothetical protein n=1 Tax=Microbacterium sp. TaxID=51671 RepID=UPI0039E7204F
MTHSFDVCALGLRVRVSFDSAASDAFVERARRAWVDALADGDGEADAQVAVTMADEDRALERLSVDVTLAALAARKGSLVMFHAAGVAAPDGRVVTFVGPSGRGKTTLTRVLAREYGYVSDETISIAEDLRVFPHRKPLSLVRPGMPKEQVPASSLGLRELPAAPLRLAGLVVLDRVDHDIEPTVERVALVEVIDELVAQLSYLPELDRPLQRLAALAASVGGVLRLTYSEAATVPPLVQRIFDGEISESADVASRPVLPGEIALDSAIVASDVVDAIEDGESTIVLSDRTVCVLSGIAPQIWRAAVSGCSRADVVDAVVDRYGAPAEGDADELVAAAIEHLAVSGLIRRTSGAKL